MRVDLKLSQQGLILAAVPLLFQLVFIAVLYQALAGAEYELAQASQDRDVIGRTDLLNKLMKADNIYYVYSLNHKPELLSDYKKMVSTIDGDLNTLKNLVGADARQSRQVEKIKATSDRIVHFIEDGRQKLAPGNQIDLSVYVTRLKALGTKLSWQIEELVEPYRQKEEVDQRQFRERLKHYLILAVAANILIALGLALIFNKGTIERLNVLMANTMRFARGQRLLPLLTGKDELAQLDGFFHRMAETVAAANRMKQEFLAMITHDIRTPLASMQGTLNLIARGAYGDELSGKTRDAMEATDHEFQRLINLINDLLDVEQLESGKLDMHFDLIPIAYVLEKSYQAIRGSADQKQISISIPDCDVEVYADGDRLVQVLINLLANAIKFSPQKGSITVSIDEDQQWVTVKVQDQGPGIAEEHHARIFDRFRQADSAAGTKEKGAGLGLAICKDIIEAHHGTLGVESAPERGSIFWFRVSRSNMSVVADSDQKHDAHTS